MAKYFQWVFQRVYAQGTETIIPTELEGLPMANDTSTPFPWYIVPPPKNYPLIATPSSIPVNSILSLILENIKRDMHFTIKMENTGDEGLYGFLQYCQIPELEVGIDTDIAAFIAGALCCTSLGLYFDDAYKPRKFMAWSPTRWDFHFLEKGIQSGNSGRWLARATVTLIRTVWRAFYGGVTHTVSRWLYYWCLKLTSGSNSYTPLVDDTFAALLSGYMWSRYTLVSEESTIFDRIIFIGWSAVCTGLLEYWLFKYFLEDPPPGLFRWLFGGAFYGPGVWQYLMRDK